MPNYEFRCIDCKARFEKFYTYSEYGQSPVVCPQCNSTNTQRSIGRIRVSHGETPYLESMADPLALASVDKDPRSLGKMMKQMSQQLGQDMGGEFNEVVGRLEKGESPTQIEKSMPDLGADMPEK